MITKELVEQWAKECGTGSIPVTDLDIKFAQRAAVYGAKQREAELMAVGMEPKLRIPLGDPDVYGPLARYEYGYSAEQLAAARLQGAAEERRKWREDMTKDEIIKAAASKLMGWKLPENFCPDCYISFDSAKAKSMKSWPTGTNLLHVGQATEMISYCLSDFLIAPEKGEQTSKQKSRETNKALAKPLSDVFRNFGKEPEIMPLIDAYATARGEVGNAHFSHECLALREQIRIKLLGEQASKRVALTDADIRTSRLETEFAGTAGNPMPHKSIHQRFVTFARAIEVHITGEKT